MKAIRRRKRLSSISIYRFINRCRLETRRCEEVRAYLAAIILLGTTVEYILSSWIRAFPAVVYSKRKKLTDNWNLKELNGLAYNYGLFSHDAFRAAERIRKYRNFVHPNWYAGRKPLRLSKYVLDSRTSDFNIIIDSIQRNI